jgi:hypothetical protein
LSGESIGYKVYDMQRCFDLQAGMRGQPSWFAGSANFHLIKPIPSGTRNDAAPPVFPKQTLFLR